MIDDGGDARGNHLERIEERADVKFILRTAKDVGLVAP
jgi:hypothetical protein